MLEVFFKSNISFITKNFVVQLLKLCMYKKCIKFDRKHSILIRQSQLSWIVDYGCNPTNSKYNFADRFHSLV